MKHFFPFLSGLVFFLLFTGCPQQQGVDPGKSDLPITTIQWEDDGTGLRQFYTNDPAKYNNGYHHLSYYSDILNAVEIQIKKTGGASNYGYGMCFCYKDYNNMYQLVITINGFYRIGKCVAGNWSYYLGGIWTSTNGQWPNSANLNKGYGAVNDLKITSNGAGTFSVYFNGIREVDFTDNSFTGGLSGCFVGIGNISAESFPNSPVDIRYKMISTNPVNTILWKDDGTGFTRYCTNESQYYNYGGVHPLGTAYTPMHTVEMDVKKISGSENYGYGTAFCYSDDNNYYQLLIVTGCYYRIAKRIGGTWSYLYEGIWVANGGSQWSHSLNLNSGYDTVNRIKVISNGTGTFTVYFNNNQETSFIDSSLTGGQVGFFYSVGQFAWEGFPGSPADIRFKLISAN
jgi:hypothetical protein